MGEKDKLRKEFNDYYQCTDVELYKALGITEEDFNLASKEDSRFKLTLSEIIQLAQTKTLLEIKDILIDNAIGKSDQMENNKIK